ncbi:divergent polysaccharide deacetylase family protein [Paracraurococcus lichenis]|uniref:Divergent polysaccharide deacetylase family protein n=1 Tax=Paracraurococcus lichenis TaxID=3064888 RepID=A0ABT9DWA8_9PROT|nr:divergent polysaccharide deacetylase family protein [Paracraurococcus sp. LOR1-02]MDO9708181.1 divergent polysaccharide deacetylase family protein [Paracraurococcus sp. LOR1-02]
MPVRMGLPRLGLGGWRGLGAFWAVVLAATAGGAGVLGWLGPLPPPPGAPPPGAAPVAEAPMPGAGAEASAAPAATPEPSPVQVVALQTPARPARPGPIAEPALLENGPNGPLPRIGPDGRTSIRAYGRAFDRQDPRPRLGLVIGGLGMNAAVTEEAIGRLPGAIGLAFSPYAPRPERLLEQARGKGMEVLVALPLEPTGYPLNNPGDRALLTGLSPSENGERLLWALSRFPGYVGAIGALGPMRGERFAQLQESLGALQATLQARGLLYLDPRPGAVKAPLRAWGRGIDLVVDEPATRSEIERKLAALEALAKEHGAALGYAGEASPVLVDRVAAWAGSVEARGLVLAPVTALIRRPEQEGARGR